MLQQTQVQTVVPYWQRWMRALPTLEAVAAATPDRIHKLWEGLGYYTRVRNLQRAARIIVKAHDGEVPRKFETLLDLPGIGRYTAGAICSIAFDQPTPILDGNVIRVLTRVFGIAGNVREVSIRKQLWNVAEELVGSAARTKFRRPCSHLNQALMELGAVICTPRAPRCETCPLKEVCVAVRQDRVSELPDLGRRPAVTRRRFVAFVVGQRGRFLVRQRPHGVVNAHLWEFPNVEVGTKHPPISDVARSLLGSRVRILGSLGRIQHSITRYRITLEGFRVAPVSSPAVGVGVWLAPRRLSQLAFASAHKKLLDRVQLPNQQLRSSNLSIVRLSSSA